MKNTLTILFLLLATAGFSQTVPDSAKAAQDQKARKRIESIRQEIIDGEKDFATAAKYYSMDPATAAQGGLFEHIKKGTFAPEFEAVAWKIPVNTVSEVIKSKYGYEILMVVARRADEIDVRHILIMPR